MATEERQARSRDATEPAEQDTKTSPAIYKLSSATKMLLSDKLIKLLTVRKRKFTPCEDDDSTPNKRIRTESSPSSSEARKLKIDLLATKAQVTMLESHVNRERTKLQEMQILFEGEKGSLIEQHKSDERAVSNMEDRMQQIRRREQEVINDYDQEKREHKDNKAIWDKQKASLQKQIADMRDQLLESRVRGQNQISEIRKDMDELLQGLENSQSEVEMLKTVVAAHKSRAQDCTTFEIKLEKQSFELQIATNKLRELEYEKNSYNDWQQQAKTAESRLINMAALEKEVARLRAQEKNLQDCIVNKLLLEEQVHVLETRVNALRPLQDELHQARVRASTFESSLAEWKTAASTQGIETPSSLSSTLETLFKGQDANTEAAEAQLQLSKLSEELASVKFERNQAINKVNELLEIRKNQNKLIHRLKKRQELISHDRDSYMQLLESYKKELTAVVSGEQASGSNEMLKTRIEQQETSLQRYRDLLITHDPTELTKLVDTLGIESSKRREEIELLKREVDRLRTHRNTLLVQLERIGAQS